MEAKVIAIATQKGGVGKTTTAQTLAAVFAQREGKKVLLVDCDMQKNLSMYVGVPEDIENSVYTILKDSEKIHDSIIHLDLYDFIPATAELSLVDVTFSESSDIFLLDDALDLVKKDYDYIIIDSGPQRSKILTMIYVCADYVIAPCDDTKGGIEGLLNLHGDIEKHKNAKHQLSKAEIIGAVITRFKPRTKLNRAIFEILKDVMNEVNPDGFALFVRDDIKVSETKMSVRSVQEYSPSCNAAMDYRTLAETVLSYIEGRSA